jgi:hypothetical protein
MGMPARFRGQATHPVRAISSSATDITSTRDISRSGAAVKRIDKSARKLWPRLNRDQVAEAAEHHDPEPPLDAPTVDALTGTWATFLLRG